MRPRTLPLLVAGALLGTQPLLAQDEENWDPRQVYMSRDQLQGLLDRFEGAASSAAYSDYLRAEARSEAALIEIRIAEGDFQVGDRILLRVQGEPTLSDTFTVSGERGLDLPDIGSAPLDGVLRAELEPYISEYLARYVRSPRVQARALIPVTIVGGVVRPGFYTVPSQLQLSDVLMVAGGPTPQAELDGLRIERGGNRIWQGPALQDAIAEGRTLDQLNVRGGDRIQLPQQGGGLGSTEASVRTLTLLLAIPATVAALITIF
jgi:protein involved in polysaccharide export with SLBB domain